MVLLNQYHVLVDKPSSEVSRAWKVFQIFLYSLAAVSGFVASHVFGVLREEFGENCILFPHIEFIQINTTDAPIIRRNLEVSTNSSQIIINEKTTNWGNDELCDFCQYVPVMSMIVGVIFITFFCMCPRGGSRESQSGIKRPWHIVLPSLIITGIFTIVIFTAAVKMQNGLNAFCAEFERELNSTRCNDDISQFTLKRTDSFSKPNLHIKLLPVMLFICVSAWFLSFILLLMRCCCFAADFKMLEISINTYEDGVSDAHLEESEVLLDPEQSTIPISHV